MEQVIEKLILDPCCGSKMFHFDKHNPVVVYGDIRIESHVLCDGRPLEINPDIQMDFTDMPFEDESFWHVVFDPPHMKTLGEKSWMALKYGRLCKDWRTVLKKGFDEAMRVCKVNGTVVFKWNETDIKVKELINVLGMQPIYGHTSGRQSKTIWMCFMKLKPTSSPLT